MSDFLQQCAHRTLIIIIVFILCEIFRIQICFTGSIVASFPLLYPSFLATNLHQSILQCRHFRDFSCSVDTELTFAICFPQQLMQAGMGTHFPSAGFSPNTPTVGPESLSVAVAVKNAINDPRLSLKPDANTQQQQQQQQQPNISSVHVS